MNSRYPIVILGLIVAVVLAWMLISQTNKQEKSADVTILISPYQDLAMYVNIGPLNLEDKYDTTVDIKTIPWEETFPTMLSASATGDLAFASYADFLTKRENLNRNTNDPLLFVYPAYIFKGGAFISFKENPPTIQKDTISDVAVLNAFLDMTIGLPASTLYEMILSDISVRAGRGGKDLRFVDVGFDAGLLGAKNGDLDAAAVGLTQLTAATADGAQVVLDMEALGISDITGFIVRKSALLEKPTHIRNAIRMWFDCVDFVYADIDSNSAKSREFLADNAAVNYTLESYKNALAQEYLPRSVGEVEAQIVSTAGTYPSSEIHRIIADYLVRSETVAVRPPAPDFEDFWRQ